MSAGVQWHTRARRALTRLASRVRFSLLVFGLPLGEAIAADVSGFVQTNLERSTAAQGSVLGLAQTLDASLLPSAGTTATARGFVRLASGSTQVAVSAVAQRGPTGASSVSGLLNEAHVAKPAEDWLCTVGKKVLSWDVGHALRPNDMVQNASRRGLLEKPLVGKWQFSCERFGSASALALVAYRHDGDGEGTWPGHGPENAAAARLYYRVAQADLYGFARLGHRSRLRVGGALSWVPGASIEVHGSYTFVGRHLAFVGPPGDARSLRATNPYAQEWSSRGSHRGVLGLTWTPMSTTTMILEALYDGLAPSDAYWEAWYSRTQFLQQAVHGSPQARAGNLAWQS